MPTGHTLSASPLILGKLGTKREMTTAFAAFHCVVRSVAPWFVRNLRLAPLTSADSAPSEVNACSTSGVTALLSHDQGSPVKKNCLGSVLTTQVFLCPSPLPSPSPARARPTVLRGSARTISIRMTSLTATSLHQKAAAPPPIISSTSSFTADSPYYNSFIESSMNRLETLTASILAISTAAKKFKKDGDILSSSTQALASSCRVSDKAFIQKEKGKSVLIRNENAPGGEPLDGPFGSELVSTLRVLADVLDEVSEAQSALCASLSAALASALEEFALKERQHADRLKREADDLTDAADGAYAKYLHGGKGGGPGTAAAFNPPETTTTLTGAAGAEDGSANPQDGPGSGVRRGQMDRKQSERSASDMASTAAKAVASKGFGFMKSLGSLTNQVANQIDVLGKEFDDKAIAAKRGDSEAPAPPPAGDGERRTPPNSSSSTSSSSSSDRVSVNSPALRTATVRNGLEGIRLSQVHAELARFKFLRRMESLKERRTFELGETALASLHGIRAYFNHVSDLTTGLTPTLSKLQESQRLAREKYVTQQEPWNAREARLNLKIDEVSAGAKLANQLLDAIQNGSATAVGTTVVEDNGTLGKVEDEIGVWKINMELSKSSLYERTSSSGVVCEGWIYKKSTKRMAMNNWNRRWFILDRQGMHYLRGGVQKGHAHGLGLFGENSQMERVQVCETLLCTVREVSDTNVQNQKLRYCFEIISPNNRPYLLQACGPNDYKMWVNSIRASIERQLSGLDVVTLKPINNKPPEEGGANAGGIEKFNSGGEESRKAMGLAKLASLAEQEHDGFVTITGAGAALIVAKSSMPVFNPNRTSSTDAAPATAGVGRSDDEDDINRSTVVEEEDDDDVNRNVVVEGGSKKTASNPTVRDLLLENPTCADCASTKPDWVSLNLGVCLCVDCAGVHRSLGVHISKVRSVTLDALSRRELGVLLALGNTSMNTIYEEEVAKGWTKPSAEDGREKRETWIKSKYQFKGFIPWDNTDEKVKAAKHSALLFEAFGNDARLGRKRRYGTLVVKKQRTQQTTTLVRSTRRAGQTLEPSGEHHCAGNGTFSAAYQHWLLALAERVIGGTYLGEGKTLVFERHVGGTQAHARYEGASGEAEVHQGDVGDAREVGHGWAGLGGRRAAGEVNTLQVAPFSEESGPDRKY